MLRDQLHRLNDVIDELEKRADRGLSYRVTLLLYKKARNLLKKLIRDIESQEAMEDSK